MIHKQDIIETVEKIPSAWEETIEKITPLLDQAAAKVAPYADQAKQAASTTAKKVAGFAADQVERIQPSISTALDKVTPAVDKAQHAIQEDIMPHLVEFLRNASETPAGQEAKEILGRLDERKDASIVALRKELAKTQKSSVTKKIVTVAAVGAVLTALAVAVKTFLGSRDDWAAYEPDEPYVYPDDAEVDAVIADAESSSQPYGDGSYRGATPPEGYAIKGNERSMKYHVPGSAGYARTTGEVWFDSEESAQAAGFVRSQR